MNGLELSLGEATLAGFLVALARAAGFVLVAPPFSTRAVPARARAGFATALALPLSTFTVPAAPRLESTPLMLSMALQVTLGALLGFFVLVAMATIQAIGDIIDAVGGFQMAMGMDPLLMVQVSVMGRLHQLTGAALLFATDAHTLVLHGLARSLQSMPTAKIDLEQAARAVTTHVVDMFAGAVEVAAPILAVMLVADVALGLLTRAAPALNAFSLGFPLKILFTLLVAGLVVVQLPEVVVDVVTGATITNLELSGARGGG